VSETPEYPNGRRVPNTELWKDTGSVEPTQKRDPEDTIAILSDTNGDGIMDRRHVFADKLELVTGFVLYKTGVIAATAPDIWYLEDTNNDQVADKRTRLYTGLGTQDTHAVINNLRWGMDYLIKAHPAANQLVTEVAEQRFQPPRLGHDVCVDEGDEWRAHPFETGHARRAGADVRVVPEQLDGRRGRRDERRHRSVVDDDDVPDGSGGGHGRPGVVPPHGHDERHVASGVPRRPWLGMRGADLDEALQQRPCRPGGFLVTPDRIDGALPRGPEAEERQRGAGQQDPTVVEPSGATVERVPQLGDPGVDRRGQVGHPPAEPLLAFGRGRSGRIAEHAVRRRGEHTS